jgi:hypothetical protein
VVFVTMACAGLGDDATDPSDADGVGAVTLDPPEPVDTGDPVG